MGIRFLCPLCAKKIHVKDHLAGLRGFCPRCGAKVNIPLESTRLSRKQRKERALRDDQLKPDALLQPDAGEPSTSKVLPRVGKLLAKRTTPPTDPLTEAPDLHWYVVPPTGTDPFGPANGLMMRQWIGEGRVATNSLVWRQDWSEWKKAGIVWSELVLADSQAQAAAAPSVPAAAPQFAAPSVPTMPGGGVGSQLARDRGVRAGSVAAAVAAPMLVPAVSLPAPAAAPQPAAPMPVALSPAGSEPHEQAVYYPPRSRTMYWVSIALLIIGLIAMSIILVYVLDENRRHQQQPPSSTDASTTEPSPSAP